MHGSLKPASAATRSDLVIILRRVVGALLCLTGVVWIGQGTNLIQGSSMTGSTFWAVAGAVCFVAGLVLLGWPWWKRGIRDEPGT